LIAPAAQFVEAYRAITHKDQKFQFRVIVDEPEKQQRAPSD
jgi:hypothetical protein